LKVTVTTRLLFKTRLHVGPETVSHPSQLPNAEPEFGAAVREIADPAEKVPLQAVAQPSPAGVLVTVPNPAPEKFTVRRKELPPDPPEPVKQITFACIVPVTIAPEEERLPALLFVWTVAEIKVLPHALPVAVIRPVESTVTICGVLEAQTTWFVISFVTGG